MLTTCLVDKYLLALYLTLWYNDINERGITTIILCRNRQKTACYAKVKIPKKSKKGYLYVVEIGERKNGKKLIKIGTTNDIKSRMGQLLRYYNQTIVVYWVSPPLEHYTTLRVEDKTKEKWKDEGHEYVRNDRFWIDENILNLDLIIRKSYTINLG